MPIDEIKFLMRLEPERTEEIDGVSPVERQLLPGASLLDLLRKSSTKPLSLTECREDTLGGATYECPRENGFVFVPVQMELLAISCSSPDSIRYAETEVIDLYDLENRCRGKEIIPNLRRQLEFYRKMLKSLDGGGRVVLKQIDTHQGDLWGIIFYLGPVHTYFFTMVEQECVWMRGARSAV